MDPYLAALASSGAVAAYLVILWAHRRLPRTPTPDSIRTLREDFYALADQFREFVEQHDREMGRYHSKVGRLRKKLADLQEGEGDFSGEEEGELETPPAPSPPVLIMPDRASQKAAIRADLRAKRGGT